LKSALIAKGFKFAVVSSPRQLENGTVVLSTISNPSVFTKKIEEFGVAKLLADPSKKNSMYAMANQQVINARLIVYSSGKVKWENDASYAFTFTPGEEGFSLFCNWILKQMLSTFSYRILELVKPNKLQVHSSLKGFDLPGNAVRLISASIKDHFKSDDFRNIEEYLEKAPESMVKASSPFLILAYFMSSQGLDFKVSVGEVKGSKYFLIIYQRSSPSSQYYDVSIRLDYDVSPNLSKDLSSMNFIAKILLNPGARIGNVVPINTRDRLIDSHLIPQDMKGFAELSFKPSTAKDMEALAHEKRGFIAKKKFGF
jgi:hypothetical protein